MKPQSNSVSELKITDLSLLTNPVNETIAFDVIVNLSKHSFCAADLWNIQKSRKIRIARRAMHN
jgi:hypothetical protein